MRVATHIALAAAAEEVLGLGQGVTPCALCVAGPCAAQVDVGAVVGVVDIALV